MSTVLPYRVRYSSGRDLCTKCGTEIRKGVIQLAIVEQSKTDDCMETKWYEQDCFFQVRRPVSENLIDGFDNVRHIHKIEILKRLGIGDTAKPQRITEEPPEKKCIIQSMGSSGRTIEEQKKKQNEDFFELRGKLKLNTKRDDRIAILKTNGQFVPEGNSEILNHVTDVIYFGAMTPCSVCKIGKLLFRNSIYSCTGNISVWSKCVNTVKEPHRVQVQIPAKYQKCLRGNFEVRTRILENIPEINDDDYELYVKQPLFDMEFFIIGETERTQNEIEHKIKQMGGRLADKVHANLAAVISNGNEINQVETVMEVAKRYGIHVVPEKFVDDVKDSDPVQLIITMDLSNWGQDPYERMPQKASSLDKLEEPCPSGVSNFQLMKWKNGSVVDPDSKLEKVAHVYGVDLKYCAILAMVDISTNKNSYYKIQLLESDTEAIYWLFESKGRIATSIGSVSVKPFSNLRVAMEAFEKVYREKTGNEFGKQFVKKPGKFNQMQVNDETPPTSLQGKDKFYSLVPSQLNNSVLKLLELLFDINIMKSAMLGFDLDLVKMPLGKLSKGQIREAMMLIHEISLLLDQHQSQPQKSATNEIIDASNRFYSQIPHNFGLRRPPVISTKEIIKDKMEMLNAMEQMEITYCFLSQEIDQNRNPIDVYYDKLKNTVEIVFLDQATLEYGEISEYVSNTQLRPNDVGYSHRGNSYNIELVDVFKISRLEEIERFKQYEGTPNRQLLWHGSRLTNFVGILKNGLKIAPPQVYITGARFGRGIYFSDSVTKSAVYCRNRHEMYGFLLLSEVALGCSEIGRSNQQTYTGCDSVKGVGKYYPHSVHVRPDDGLIIPNGYLARNANNHLKFNEFVIFDESRVKMRYLVKVKFNRSTFTPNFRPS